MIAKLLTIPLFAGAILVIAACGSSTDDLPSTSPGVVRGNVPTTTPWPSPPDAIFVDGSGRPTGTGTGTPRPTGTGGQTTYTVQSGDTLSSIAGRFGVDLQELARVNNITNPSNIEVGQVLTIPRAGASPSPTATSQPSPTPTRTATPTPTPTGGACTNPYIVQSGDYPGLIAQKCGVDVATILELNDIDPSNLQVGQQIRIR